MGVFAEPNKETSYETANAVQNKIKNILLDTNLTKQEKDKQVSALIPQIKNNKDGITEKIFTYEMVYLYLNREGGLPNSVKAFEADFSGQIYYLWHDETHLNVHEKLALLQYAADTVEANPGPAAKTCSNALDQAFSAQINFVRYDTKMNVKDKTDVLAEAADHLSNYSAVYASIQILELALTEQIQYAKQDKSLNIREKINAISEAANGLVLIGGGESSLSIADEALSSQLRYLSLLDKTTESEKKTEILLAIPPLAALMPKTLEAISKGYDEQNTHQNKVMEQYIEAEKWATEYQPFVIKVLGIEAPYTELRFDPPFSLIYSEQAYYDEHRDNSMLPSGDSVKAENLPSNMAQLAKVYFEAQIKSAQVIYASISNRAIRKSAKIMEENAKKCLEEVSGLGSEPDDRRAAHLLMAQFNQSAMAIHSDMEKEGIWDSMYKEAGSVWWKNLLIWSKENAQNGKLWSALALYAVNEVAGELAFLAMGSDQIVKGVKAKDPNAIIWGGVLAFSMARWGYVSTAAQAGIAVSALEGGMDEFRTGLDIGFTQRRMKDVATNALMAAYFTAKIGADYKLKHDAAKIQDEQESRNENEKKTRKQYSPTLSMSFFGIGADLFNFTRTSMLKGQYIKTLNLENGGDYRFEGRGVRINQNAKGEWTVTDTDPNAGSMVVGSDWQMSPLSAQKGPFKKNDIILVGTDGWGLRFMGNKFIVEQYTIEIQKLGTSTTILRVGDGFLFNHSQAGQGADKTILVTLPTKNGGIQPYYVGPGKGVKLSPGCLIYPEYRMGDNGPAYEFNPRTRQYEKIFPNSYTRSGTGTQENRRNEYTSGSESGKGGQGQTNQGPRTGETDPNVQMLKDGGVYELKKSGVKISQNSKKEWVVDDLNPASGSVVMRLGGQIFPLTLRLPLKIGDLVMVGVEGRGLKFMGDRFEIGNYQINIQKFDSKATLVEYNSKRILVNTAWPNLNETRGNNILVTSPAPGGVMRRYLEPGQAMELGTGDKFYPNYKFGPYDYTNRVGPTDGPACQYNTASKKYEKAGANTSSGGPSGSGTGGTGQNERGTGGTESGQRGSGSNGQDTGPRTQNAGSPWPPTIVRSSMPNHTIVAAADAVTKVNINPATTPELVGIKALSGINATLSKNVKGELVITNQSKTKMQMVTTRERTRDKGIVDDLTSGESHIFAKGDILYLDSSHAGWYYYSNDGNIYFGIQVNNPVLVHEILSIPEGTTSSQELAIYRMLALKYREVLAANIDSKQYTPAQKAKAEMLQKLNSAHDEFKKRKEAEAARASRSRR